MFQDQDSAMTILRARPLLPARPAGQAALRSVPGARPPQFLVLWGGSGWWGSLRALCTRAHWSGRKESIVLFRNTPVAAFRFPAGSVTASVFLHLVAILVLPFLLALPPGRDITSVAAYSEPEKIYYRLTTHDPFEKLPRIAPSGSGGHPGAGTSELHLPVLGSTAAHHVPYIIACHSPRPEPSGFADRDAEQRPL